ncbi:MAG: type IV pilin protein [Microcystaceae cyanobacterium]
MNNSSPIGRLLINTDRTGQRSHLGVDSAGFTLLEILIVCIIVGILAAIALPSYVATIDKFRYGEAKMQMGCLATELKAFRLEKGYFPADKNRDTKPDGIECFYTQAGGKVPFDSKYDYDNRIPAANSCYIQIVFLGKNGEKEVPNGSTAIYPNAGIYEYSDIAAGSDDLVFSLGTNPLGQAC